MDAARLPPDVRERALAIIQRELRSPVDCSATLADFQPVLAVQALIALEEAFGIPIEVDEVLPNGTVAGLLILVQSRVMRGPRLPQQPPVKLYDLAAYKAARHPANEDRPPAAERGFAVPEHPPAFIHPHDRARRARLIRLGLILTISAGAFAALVFWLAKP